MIRKGRELRIRGMKLPVVLAVLVGTVVLACSSAETVPSTVAPVSYVYLWA